MDTVTVETIPSFIYYKSQGLSTREQFADAFDAIDLYSVLLQKTNSNCSGNGSTQASPQQDYDMSGIAYLLFLDIVDATKMRSIQCSSIENDRKV